MKKEGNDAVHDSVSATKPRDEYKRRFDICVLVLAHLLFFPMWLFLWTLIPILIWLEDRGAVFYEQQRMGKDGVPFSVIKFRTMVMDAEAKGPAWTIDNDPRITRVGRILRQTALDELPEVISILKGDMSFVGPRALDLSEQRSLEELIPGFEDRLKVRPGLTGLAQIYDKNDDPYDKYRFDMEYIQKLNPFLDARLLLLSVWNTLIAQWDHRSGKVKLDGLNTKPAATPDSQEDPSRATPSDSRKNDA